MGRTFGFIGMLPGFQAWKKDSKRDIG